MIDATRPDAIASMLRTLETYADQAKGTPAVEPPAQEGVDFGAAVQRGGSSATPPSRVQLS